MAGEFDRERLNDEGQEIAAALLVSYVHVGQETGRCAARPVHGGSVLESPEPIARAVGSGATDD